MNLSITPDERDELVQAVHSRICHIETGTPILRASDALQAGKGGLLRRLTEHQRDFIASQEALIAKLRGMR